MELPPGCVDPMFLHELALQLHMTVGELKYGRGTPMSAAEMGVEWPAFFRAKDRERSREEKKRQMERRKV